MIYRPDPGSSFLLEAKSQAKPYLSGISRILGFPQSSHMWIKKDYSARIFTHPTALILCIYTDATARGSQCSIIWHQQLHQTWIDIRSSAFGWHRRNHRTPHRRNRPHIFRTGLWPVKNYTHTERHTTKKRTRFHINPYTAYIQEIWERRLGATTYCMLRLSSEATQVGKTTDWG